MLKFSTEKEKAQLAQTLSQIQYEANIENEVYNNKELLTKHFDNMLVYDGSSTIIGAISILIKLIYYTKNEYYTRKDLVNKTDKSYMLFKEELQIRITRVVTALEEHLTFDRRTGVSLNDIIENLCYIRNTIKIEPIIDRCILEILIWSTSKEINRKKTILQVNIQDRIKEDNIRIIKYLIDIGDYDNSKLLLNRDVTYIRDIFIHALNRYIETKDIEILSLLDNYLSGGVNSELIRKDRKLREKVSNLLSKEENYKYLYQKNNIIDVIYYTNKTDSNSRVVELIDWCYTNIREIDLEKEIEFLVNALKVYKGKAYSIKLENCQSIIQGRKKR